MAEVIGVIASGIAIGQATATITTSLLKLKMLWSQMKGSGDDLTHLLREIEITILVLAESEDQQQPRHNEAPSRALQGAFQLTNDAARELEALVAELETRWRQSRGWKKQIAAAKAVMERDQIKRYKSRLKRCIRLLTLAQSCKISAMLERQPALLSQQLTRIICETENLEDENDNSDEIFSPENHVSNSIQKARNPAQRSTLQMRLHMFRRLWYIYSYHSATGWDFGFRVFYHISRRSRLADLVKRDAVEDIREMFVSGQASPQAILREHGRRDISLLAYSVRHASSKVCQLLLNEGAKIADESLDSNNSPLINLLSNTNQILKTFSVDKIGQSAHLKRLDSISTIVLRDPGLSLPARTNIPIAALVNGPVLLFQRFQTTLFPDYYKFSIKTRATYAILHSLYSTADVFWAALGNDFRTSDINQTYNVLGDQRNITLLGQVAFRIGFSLFEDRFTPCKSELCAALYRPTTSSRSDIKMSILTATNYPFCGWQAAVNQLLSRGADLNLPAQFGTPFCQVLRGAYSWYAEKGYIIHNVPKFSLYLKYPNRGTNALHAWLETLEGSGVNLEEYGEIEKEVQAEEFHSMPLFLGAYPSRKLVSSIRLISMQIGPKPQDWKFWFSDPTDQFAGEFWDMIDHPERSIPGAWDEFSW